MRAVSPCLRALTVVSALLTPMLAAAAFPDAATTLGPATIHGCYDGDTCTISIPGLPGLFGDRLPLRLAGIDTPEMKGKCDQEKMLALQAKSFLTERLERAQTIDIELIARDKYFRVLSLIVADGVDLADEMVKAGLANAYHGGTKQRWCPKRGHQEPLPDVVTPQGAVQ